MPVVHPARLAKKEALSKLSGSSSVIEGMGKKQAPKEKPKEKPAHIDEARQVVGDYAKDLREFLEKFPKRLN